MRQLNMEQLEQFSSFNTELDEKYGALGTPSRNQFDEQSLAWFYGNILRERRKELNLTQKQVADKIGREQSYIARVESGKTDILRVLGPIVLSSFRPLANL